MVAAPAVMAGRVRPRPMTTTSSAPPFSSSEYFSVCPTSLPSSLIAVHCADDHRADDRKRRQLRTRSSGPVGSERSGLVSIHQVEGGSSIIDHCWSSVLVDKGKARARRQTIVLAVLTRPRRIRLGEGQEGVLPPHRPSTASVLRLYTSKGGVIDDDDDECNDNDEEDDGRGLLLARTVELPRAASAVAADGNVLAVATSSGASLYHLPSLLDGKCGETGTRGIAGVELMRTHAVHAMCLSYPYLTAASGDRLGVWRVDGLFVQVADVFGKDDCNGHRGPPAKTMTATTTAAAIWSTTVPRCKHRVTSLAISGSTLALSCWDGTAFVYRRSPAEGLRWERVCGHDSTPPPPWELPSSEGGDATFFPTFVALSSEDSEDDADCELPLLLAVSTPGSDAVRCYDVRAITRLDDVSGASERSMLIGDQSPSVQGMLSMRGGGDCGSVLWVDDRDWIHRRPWPARRTARRLDCAPLPAPVTKVRVASSCIADAWIVRDVTGLHPPWRLECRWKGTDGGSASDADLAMPFLNNRDVASMVKECHDGRQQGKDAANIDGCSPDQTQPAFVSICEQYVGIVSPADDMMYIYSRKDEGWKAIDLKDKLIERDNCETDLELKNEKRAGIKVVFQEPNLVAVVCWNTSTSFHVRVWDLSKSRASLAQHRLLFGEYVEHLQSLYVDQLQLCPVSFGFCLFAVSCEVTVDGHRGVLVWILADPSEDCNPLFVSLVGFKSLGCDQISLISCSMTDPVKLNDSSYRSNNVSNLNDLSLFFEIGNSVGTYGWQYLPKDDVWKALKGDKMLAAEEG